MRLGCDPEVFLISKTRAEFVSAVGKVPGTKEEPAQILGLPKGFTMQQDNVACEFGIPPAESAAEFAKYVRDVQAGALSRLKGVKFSTVSCVDFPVSELKTAEANIFGCEPDFDAWTGKENPAPNPPKRNTRSAGGHIHVETRLPKEAVIRGMDMFLGVPSLFLDPDGERRRSMYGRPGAFRPKSYGVEYRVLSNFWIFNPSLPQWVWDSTRQVLDRVIKREKFNDEQIRECILNNDKSLAEKLMVKYGVVLP